MTTSDEFTVGAFQRFLDQRKLVGSRCQKCGALSVPPRGLCPRCQGTQMTLEELSGRGTLAGFTSISIVPTAMAQEGYGRDKPYLTGVVALAEGPRIAARLADMDATKPQEVKIGTSLQAVFQDSEHEGQKRVVLAFGPAARRRGRR
ncbi:MAG: Zn-ribbon domain-containing OB-fold protein [Dehalococcoidia bacterium]|nr:Zn-ribbon domain-containing OB-fold protein [Dehalococcoidia bacterium]